MRVGLLAFLVVVTHAAEPAGKEKFAPTFAPLLAGHARLAPDGRHVAYSLREGDEIFAGVVDIDAAALKMRQSVGLMYETPIGSFMPAGFTYVTFEPPDSRRPPPGPMPSWRTCNFRSKARCPGIR